MSTMSAADRRLLREVFREARRRGLRHGSVARCWHDDSDNYIELTPYGDEWVMDVNTMCRFDVVTVPLAVDILAALGVLPQRFSSAYATGYGQGRDDEANAMPHAIAEAGAA